MDTYKSFIGGLQFKSLTLEQLQDEVEKDLELRTDRCDQDSANTPKIHNKYHRQYRLVKEEYNLAEIRFKALWREKWLYYSGKKPREFYDEHPLQLKIMKSDVKMFIESDEDIMQATVVLRKLENKLGFLRRVIEEINRRSFHIKNVVETLKFINGVN